MGFYNSSPGPRPSSFRSNNRSTISSAKSKSNHKASEKKVTQDRRLQRLEENRTDYGYQETLRDKTNRLLSEKSAIMQRERDDLEWAARIAKLEADEASEALRKTLNQIHDNMYAEQKPTPADDVASMHETAHLMVALNETRKAIETDLHPGRKTPEEILAETQKLDAEDKVIQNRLRGESLMFANQIRKADIFGEIEKTEKNQKTLWHRIKVMIGWE